ncbi:hypothetical protein BGW41_007851 [Actinomortierella wolfii]|nr:hypothetical protein BGW41_007851 [Actinomortierella wolfii]
MSGTCFFYYKCCLLRINIVLQELVILFIHVAIKWPFPPGGITTDGDDSVRNGNAVVHIMNDVFVAEDTSMPKSGVVCETLSAMSML